MTLKFPGPMSSLPADPACRDESREPVASLEPFAKLMRDHYGTRILEGPFQGLIYGDRSFGSMYWPKLLGTYEKELSACFTAHNLCQYDLFLNLGCAEGYYAN